MPKICVVGAGPCGTFLAYKLAKEGHEVHLFEKESYMGGCWASLYPKGKFAEHSPRIMFNNYYNTIQFFREIGIEFKEEFRKVMTVMGDSITYMKYLTLFDIISLSRAYLAPLSTWKGYSMKDLCDYYKMSKGGERLLSQLCYLMDGASLERITAKEFLHTLDTTMLYSGYEPKTNSDMYLIPKLKGALESVGVKVHMNYTLSRFQGKEIHFEHDGMMHPFTFDHSIVCIPPPFFTNVLKYSDREYRDGWGDFQLFSKLCDESYYSGIGVQFHFSKGTKKMRFKQKTVGDWHIISTYNNQSRCLSCVIVDLDLVSSFTQKTANESSKDQILNEVWRQLSEQWKASGEKRIEYESRTLTPGLKKVGERYKMDHGAFLYRGKFIKSKPANDLNVSYVGPHNETSISFTSYESAIQSAKLFLRDFKYYKTRQTIFKPIGFKVFLVYLFFLFLVFYLIFKRC